MGKIILASAVVCLVGLVGCVNVQTPRIPENVVNISPRVDASSVPQTNTLDECQSELYRAYGHIRSQERKIQKLEGEKSELKEKVSRLEKQLKRYTD